MPLRSIGKRLFNSNTSKRMAESVAGVGVRSTNTVNRVGNSRLGSPLAKAAIGGAAITGLSSGFGNTPATDSFYELTTGSPDFDQYALGTDFGMQDLLLPTPLNVTRRGIGNTTNAMSAGYKIGGVAGAGAGLYAGKGVRGRLTFGLMGAFGGAAAGAGAGFAGTTQGTVNTTTIGDYNRYGRGDRRYQNNLPIVDGSMVFGQYNSRMGGY